MRAADEQIARFQLQASEIARIQHPGIVEIYEDSEQNGLRYLALEFIPGGNLAQLIAGMPQPPRRAATMVMELCRTIAYAHAHCVLHRDLKPANVLLTANGEPKIGDFGLAKPTEGGSRQTHSQPVVGTPNNPGPEQVWGRSGETGTFSDQYALGAILYEMLVGRPPFQGATPLETLELVRKQKLVPPRRLQPGVPKDLEAICLKALQKTPARRYPDVACLADDLRRFVYGRPVDNTLSLSERVWRRCERNPRIACLFVAIVLMGIAIAAGSAVFMRR